MMNESLSVLPRMYPSGATSTVPRSMSLGSESAPVISNRASYSGFMYGSIFSYSVPGRNPRRSPASTAGRVRITRETSFCSSARTAGEAGERLGFLPGTLYEKIDPYMKPLYDALFEMMGADALPRLMERGTVEVAPLAYMRGRTLNDSFIILDEAQNTTPEQMKMFLTRLGFGSKAVVNGDVTQIDLPTGQTSGLVIVQEILRGIEGIEVAHLGARDVVRHKIVQDIVEAYRVFGEQRARADG